MAKTKSFKDKKSTEGWEFIFSQGQTLISFTDFNDFQELSKL